MQGGGLGIVLILLAFAGIHLLADSADRADGLFLVGTIIDQRDIAGTPFAATSVRRNWWRMGNTASAGDGGFLRLRQVMLTSPTLSFSARTTLTRFSLSCLLSTNSFSL